MNDIFNSNILEYLFDTNDPVLGSQLGSFFEDNFNGIDIKSALPADIDPFDLDFVENESDDILENLVQNLNDLERKEPNQSHCLATNSVTLEEHSYCQHPFFGNGLSLDRCHSQILSPLSTKSQQIDSPFSFNGLDSGYGSDERTRYSSDNSDSATIIDIASTQSFDDASQTIADFVDFNMAATEIEVYSSSSNDTKLQISDHDLNASNKYSPLNLTEEEKQLCLKEGVRLPSHYPLTKYEEKQLRRIRRKIRNKVSAQASRRKKNEYIEALEHRVSQSAKQNIELRRKVEQLTNQNKLLAVQLKNLQNSMYSNNGNNRRVAQTGTCLAVLLLSFALLVAPHYSPFAKRSDKKQSNALVYNHGDNQQAVFKSPLSGHSRTLLQTTEGFDEVNKIEEEALDNLSSKKFIPQHLPNRWPTDTVFDDLEINKSRDGLVKQEEKDAFGMKPELVANLFSVIPDTYDVPVKRAKFDSSSSSWSTYSNINDIQIASKMNIGESASTINENPSSDVNYSSSYVTVPNRVVIEEL